MPAQQRVHAAELAKLFNSVEQPIYVLDEELTIVFLNRACQQWLGPAAEGLLGQRCAYHSSPQAVGPEAVAAGLCPPPKVLLGEISQAVVFRPAEDGRPIERQARFLPFGPGGEDVLGIVAVLSASDQPPTSAGGCRNDDTNEGYRGGASDAGPTALHEHIRRFRQEAAARCRADRLIGQGTAMRLARRQVELAAASRCSVLLVGPPGSGRRHLAAAIHYGASPASSGSGSLRALAPLDCSLLGADLLEVAAEAVLRQTALSEQTPPGTLLFHRVDELAVEVQVQLTDFLMRRPPAWRLIATAAAPLSELSRHGKFRADLAALLSTIVVELPPLAQRRDDLPLLAQLFLEEHNAAAARQIGGFSPAALDRLDAYAWPGNLDELAQVVSEAHRRAAGPEIGVEDLPERLRWATQAAAQPRRADETIVLDEYLGRVERELLRRALARAKGNKAQAARMLGVTRPRLYRRMVQLGLE